LTVRGRPGGLHVRLLPAQQLARGLRDRPEQHKNPVTVWTKNFSNLWLNYAAGSSIAVLLVYKSNHIEWAYLFFVFPLLAVLF
jgi:hypothetical protein